jgi:cyclohexadieny/prephenate dehydrogenase
MAITKVAIIGLGLLGGSIGLAAKEFLSGVTTTGFDMEPGVRVRAGQRGLVDKVCGDAAEAVHDADLVIFCVPVGAIPVAAAQIKGSLPANAIISDVGSSKQTVGEALRSALPDHTIIPAHPVAGTERSGPEAGFATLFQHRWCILTPEADAPAQALDDVRKFWEGMGARIEVMDAAHHDLVLAVTSHIPHLIAYTIVGTASDLEDVTRSEVIKYSAGGFRDFTRIAASDPTMWRDVFLHNRGAVLEMLGRFSKDLAEMQQAIQSGNGDALFDLFSRTRDIRNSIIEMGQDDARPDFGRTDHTDQADHTDQENDES